MKLIEFNPEVSFSAPCGSRLSSRVPIVIAEDDLVSQTLLAGLLRNAGYDPIVTSNGGDAMTALRLQQKACVAIVDWMMPEMDGAEVCRRVRASGNLVHIIMLTARDRKDDAVEALDAGADDYLVKPFDRGELLARVRAGMRTLEVLAFLSQQAVARTAAPAHVMQLPL
ncbi:MAG: response regulator transcription factor [Verrucomicrobiota bacterium]|nr:response regulator transcription factor [Verrucomicrobiota bacterium]